MPKAESVFEPLPAQWRLFQSTAKIRGYGGAMGGGKTRALCELAFDLCLSHPGIVVPICRQSHVSIVGTTRRTMFEQVLPQDVVEHTKASQGEDFVRLKNGSEIHFFGLDNPGRFFSAEYGFACFDEAHQITEDAVVKTNTRLRQRCRDCIKARIKECEHFPHGILLTFNPENPGHWLWRWFLKDSEPLEFIESSDGKQLLSWSRKDRVVPTEAVASIGSGEFILSRATDNPYVSRRYIEENLGGMPERDRRRYLEGEWLYTSGRTYFDTDALSAYQAEVKQPVWVCSSEGDLTGRNNRARIRLVPQPNGRWYVWEAPVRERDDPDDPFRKLPAHRYVIAIDVSSGTSNDQSAIQVLDVESFRQVAEFQGLLDMDELAVEAFRAAVVYNGAILVPETTGGWGFAVSRMLMKMLSEYRGPEGQKPKPYTRRRLDRLSKKWTDVVGWDTNVATRSMMLAILEEVIRKGEFGLRSRRCLDEMAAFVWRETDDEGGPFQKPPAAQPGMNDDLVMSLAIAVAVALERPRELRRPVERQYVRQLAATGF